MDTVVEPYPAAVVEQLNELGVDHAIAVLIDDGIVIGYTMCHQAGPKNARLRCVCETDG